MHRLCSPLLDHLVRILLAALLLVTAAAGDATAQTPFGTVEGVARGADTGAPLPFSLVRLAPDGAPTDGPARSTATDAAGRFRFADVAPGAYRLQVERIGLQRTRSQVLLVRAGETLTHELRGAVEPVRLAALAVGAEERCLDAAGLAQDSALHLLWSEALKGVETRRAVRQQFRFTRIWRQDIALRRRLLGSAREVRVDTVVNEPDSVAVRERRRSAEIRARGYGRRGALLIALPNETDLLDHEFLRTHCLEATVDEVDGARALRFRPVRARRDAMDIRGTVWLDARTFSVRRLELEWLEDTRSIARGHVDYEDVALGGARLRLPVRGHLEGRPSGVMGTILVGATAAVTFTYSGFEQVAHR